MATAVARDVGRGKLHRALDRIMDSVQGSSPDLSAYNQAASIASSASRKADRPTPNKPAAYHQAHQDHLEAAKAHSDAGALAGQAGLADKVKMHAGYAKLHQGSAELFKAPARGRDRMHKALDRIMDSKWGRDIGFGEIKNAATSGFHKGASLVESPGNDAEERRGRLHRTLDHILDGGSRALDIDAYVSPDGKVHPIRNSEGYKRSAAGEKPKGRKKKAGKKK